MNLRFPPFYTNNYASQCCPTSYNQLIQPSHIFSASTNNNNNYNYNYSNSNMFVQRYIAPITKLKSKDSRPGEDLKRAIQQFALGLENSPDQTQQISTLSCKFTIKRRRLYDVINVLEAIGCCQKCGLDSVKWFGKDNIEKTIDHIKKERSIHDPTKMLSDIFPVPCCVGISSLTISFLLMFFALKKDRIDLRYVSQFFSRDTTRYKTTLCKLYQICYILGAIGVTTRTSQVCEIILNQPFYNEETIMTSADNFCMLDSNKGNNNQNGNCKILSDNKTMKPIVYNNNHFFSISSLLNHQKEADNNYLEERRKEMIRCFEEAEEAKEKIADSN